MILKSVRSSLSKGYPRAPGQTVYDQFKESKRDVWRLLIVIDRLKKENETLGVASDRVAGQVGVD